MRHVSFLLVETIGFLNMPTVEKLRDMMRVQGLTGGQNAWDWYSTAKLRKSELEAVLELEITGAIPKSPPSGVVSSPVVAVSSSSPPMLGGLAKERQLPAILLKVQELLNEALLNGEAELRLQSDDGRVNSILDEDEAKKILRIKLSDDYAEPPRGTIRHWWDFKLHDVEAGWIPVNFKSTTGDGADNAGGMSLMLYG